MPAAIGRLSLQRLCHNRQESKLMVQKQSLMSSTSPAALIVTADDGGVGKTHFGVQLANAFHLYGKPLDLYQIDTKGKLAAKSGQEVTSLVVPERQSRAEELVAADVIAPWYRAVTAMPETGRSSLLEVGGAMAGMFHAAITDLDLTEDIDALHLDMVVFVLCKAGEDSVAQLLRELGRLERNMPNARPVIVANEFVGNPVASAQYLDSGLRKAFSAALKKHPVIRMPKMRARSMAIYERMHVLPSTIVGWHLDNYAEAIQRVGGQRDEAKLFVKDVAEWSGVILEEIERVLPTLAGGSDA
jgi:hypothetical protein